MDESTLWARTGKPVFDDENIHVYEEHSNGAEFGTHVDGWYPEYYG